MMVSDDERRKVACRLREFEIGVIGTVIPTSELAKNILKAIGYGHSSAMTPYGLLADLIEPSIPEDPGEAGLESVNGFIREMRHSTKEEQNEYGTMLKKMSVELHPVDRDALLELADEMEERRKIWSCTAERSWSRSIARRIREALGVES